jgi:hypothetical protein
MFCVPFYDLLDQVGKRAAHSFKSETPLIDALIMFMREYKVLKSSASVEQLNRTLKSEDLERYGEPFTPEFVYDAIRQLSRFDSMRVSYKPPSRIGEYIANICCCSVVTNKTQRSFWVSFFSHLMMSAHTS